MKPRIRKINEFDWECADELFTAVASSPMTSYEVWESGVGFAYLELNKKRNPRFENKVLYTCFLAAFILFVWLLVIW